MRKQVVRPQQKTPQKRLRGLQLDVIVLVRRIHVEMFMNWFAHSAELFAVRHDGQSPVHSHPIAGGILVEVLGRKTVTYSS